MPPQRYVLRKVPAAQWKQWDQFVNEHPRGHFLQSWGWGELKANGGLDPLRLAPREEQQQPNGAAAPALCPPPAHPPLLTGPPALFSQRAAIARGAPPLSPAFFTPT